MPNFVIAIILSILTFVTIRDLISKFFGIPRNKNWSWIFYNQYDRELLRDMLYKFGFTEERVKRSLKNAKGKIHKYKENDKKLLEFISRYTYNLEVEYGVNSAVKSNYYINTIGASHISNDLLLMVRLLSFLMNDENPDFVITPKNGNPVLGREFAETNNIISILSKHERDPAYAKTNARLEPEATLMINFEGSNGLLELEKENPNRELTGVVIDCNISDGDQVFDAIYSFNELIDNINNQSGNKLRIKKISKAFILFKVDQEVSSVKVDKKFNDEGYQLYRYFDLDNDLKKEIYEYKINSNKTIFNYYVKKNKKSINGFINKLKELSFYKFNNN